MKKLNITKNIKKIVKQALKEDIGKGDVTTNSLIPKKSRIKVCLFVKQAGVVAGLDLAEYIFQKLNSKIKFKKIIQDGDFVKANTVVAEIKGDAVSVFTAERLVLNFMQRLSGIATETKKYVNEVKDLNVDILDTRKTTPGLRELERYGVRAGGGVNHRFGLFDQILIKENHLLFLKQYYKDLDYLDIIKKAIKESCLKTNKKKLVEIEVENIDEALCAVKENPDIIMFDNMSCDDIKTAIVKIKSDNNKKIPLFEASGGITFKNVREYAEAGVNRISIGALTHSYTSLDISLEAK
jgi:nicotinate-nucleotide pyrophosphorylase (carboxylating)